MIDLTKPPSIVVGGVTSFGFTPPTTSFISEWKESNLMKKFIALSVAALLSLAGATTTSAQLISEFEANPPGADPTTSPVELSGTAGSDFNGFLTFLETDGTGEARGAINSSDAVSGTFDSNGLALITLNFDVENPSFTLVFSSLAPTADVDANDDGVIDDATVFGTVFDAVGIIDAAGDSTDFATALGGVEFATPDEFEIVFRDASTGEFFGFDAASGNTFNTAGTAFVDSDFSFAPSATTFGTVNPTFDGTAVIPEPSSLALLGLVGFAGLVRRRR